jgi:hypothetical protein
MYFSPKRVLNVPGRKGVIRPVGSNQWNTIDDLSKAEKDPDIAFIGIGNLGENTNQLTMGGCRALPLRTQNIHQQQMFSAPQSEQQTWSYFDSGNFGKGNGCDDGVIQPYMAQTYQPLVQHNLDQCRKLLSTFEDGSLNNLQEIKSQGSDPRFPADETSIAERGTDCGDSARGIKEPCSKFDHWLSIMGMFGRVGSSSTPSRPNPAPVRPQPSIPSTGNFPSCFKTSGSANHCTVSNKCNGKVKIKCATATGFMKVTFPTFEYTYVNQNQPWCDVANCQFDGLIAQSRSERLGY